MIDIVPLLKNGMEATTINQNDVNKAARSAIDAIKNELPEEAQTVEVMEYVISEMDEMIKQKKIVL